MRVYMILLSILGGRWEGDNFRPSVQMVTSGATKGLAEYMTKVEPNSKLLVPIPMSKNVFAKATQ